MDKLSPIIFKTEEKTYRVQKMQNGQTKFDKDTAYLLSEMNKFVFPYRGKIDHTSEMYEAGLYLYRGHAVCMFPSNDEEKKKYDKKRLIYLTPDSIFKDLNKTPLEELPETIMTDGDVFKPMLRPTDDIALAAMKYAIGKKNINFNTYASRFSDVATKNNGRRALTHGNTLKMDMLNRFADVFDINAAIVVWDKEGCPNPMSPNRDKAYVIYNDEKLDFKDPDISIEEINREE